MLEFLQGDNLFKIFEIAFYVLSLPIILDILKQKYWQGSLLYAKEQGRQIAKLFFYSLLIFILIVFFLDSRIDQAIIANDPTRKYNNIFTFITQFGKTDVVGVVLILLLAFAKMFNWTKFSNICKLSFFSMLAAGSLNIILKLLVNRARPYIAYNPYDFFSYTHDWHNIIKASHWSFTSGHTTTIVAILLPFILAYRSTLVRLFTLSIWLLVASSRVYTFNHWSSDVFMGSVFGVIVSYIFFESNRSKLSA